PRFVDGGQRVRALVRDPASAKLPAGVEAVQGDLGDAESLARAVEGMDVVVHLAAVTADRKPPPGGYDAINADGTAALARAAAAAGVRGVVQMGGIDTARDRARPDLAGP